MKKPYRMVKIVFKMKLNTFVYFVLFLTVILTVLQWEKIMIEIRKFCILESFLILDIILYIRHDFYTLFNILTLLTYWITLVKEVR